MDKQIFERFVVLEATDAGTGGSLSGGKPSTPGKMADVYDGLGRKLTSNVRL
jgi:hypothetical protein